MHTPMKLLAVTLILSLLATPATHAQEDPRLEGWPDWVKEAMTKELRRKKTRAVSAPDDAFRTTMLGKLEEQQTLEDGWYFNADIKAESPLECYAFTSSRDLATLLTVIAEANIEAVAAAYGPVQSRTVYHTESGAIAGFPYLALEWLYRVQGETQPMAAFTKVRAAAKGNMAFVCAHNYLGYRDTFADAFEAFVTEAEYEETTAAPYYEEIASVDMKNFGSGINYTSYTIDADGDTRAFIVNASITVTDPSTTISTDAYQITYTGNDGAVLNMHSISVDNGELSNNLELRRNEDGDWVSSGTLQGKDFEQYIDGAQEPTSELRQIGMAKALFEGDDTSIAALVWMPSIDPGRFLETTMTRDDADIERQATMTLGPISYAGQFDEDGNMITAVMNIGPASFDIRRIWAAGSMTR